MNERYEIRGMLIYAVLEDGTDESLAVMSNWAIETGGAELVRRANALPEVEAKLASCYKLADTLAANFEKASNQLAEAAELLEWALSAAPEPIHDGKDGGVTSFYADRHADARAFLAKVKP